MKETLIRLASPADKEPIIRLLSGFNLPTEDIGEHLNNFIVAVCENHLAGCVGVEIYGRQGLLRSLAVEESFRNGGLGKQLCSHLAAFAAESGVRQLHLLTTTAEGFFKKLGFETARRDVASEEIKSTREFSHLCPSTAIYMTRDISRAN
jgi:amino-acid N-acetyltransferase